MINLIVTGILVIVSLVIFKSGWLLEFLDNFPFIDNVVGLVKGYLGVSSGTPLPAAGKAFFEELLKSIVFLTVFAVISKAAQSLFYIGKHEKISDFSRWFSRPLKWIASNFLSAVITGLLVGYVSDCLQQVWNLSTFWMAGVSLLVLVPVMFLAFLFLGKTVTEFVVQMAVGVIFASVVKLVAVEFIIVFLYMFLNIPGVFTEAGTLVIMLIGILCCLGSIVGAELLGSKFD